MDGECIDCRGEKTREIAAPIGCAFVTDEPAQSRSVQNTQLKSRDVH